MTTELFEVLPSESVTSILKGGEKQLSSVPITRTQNLRKKRASINPLGEER